MKAPSTMTIARKTVGTKTVILTSILSLALIVLVNGCEQAEQPESQSSTAAQQQAQPDYPVIGGQAQPNPSEAGSADPSFFKSIEAGDVAAVQAALDAGTDPNTKNAQGLSAVELATAQGQSSVVEALLERQPVLGVGETQPRSPQFESLLLAARQGDNATIQVLIERGIDINVQDPHTQQTALMAAAERGHVQTAKMLLENGANPNIRDPRGYPLLIQAALKGDVDIATALLQHGANPNATEDINKWTALMMAAENSDAKMVELLVNYEADVNIADPKGKTAVDIASQSNDEETIAAIQAKPQSPSGLAPAKKPATGLILIPAPSDVEEETEQPESTQPSSTAPAAVENGTAADEAQKSKQLTQLFARAQQQFQMKNLTTPKGDNALDTCLEIFKLAPGHADTVELVRKMEQQYRDWATSTKNAKRQKAYTEKAQELAALVQ